MQNDSFRSNFKSFASLAQYYTGITQNISSGFSRNSEADASFRNLSWQSDSIIYLITILHHLFSGPTRMLQQRNSIRKTMELGFSN